MERHGFWRLQTREQYSRDRGRKPHVSRSMLYNRSSFKSEDRKAAFALMEANPFATVVTIFNDQAQISHLPLVPQKAGEDIELIGHLARANPHSRTLASSMCNVIFHGAHTYITPKWYKENDVPTWNYSVVHIEGKVTLIEEASEIIECLKILSGHTEKLWPSGWEFFLPEDLSNPKDIENSIVGFRISIEKLNFKQKLSQNRSQEDKARVIEGLRSRTDDLSRGVMQDMKSLKR